MHMAGCMHGQEQQECGSCVYVYLLKHDSNAVVLQRVIMSCVPACAASFAAAEVVRGHGAGCQPHIEVAKKEGERGRPAGAAADAASVASRTRAGCQRARQDWNWCVQAEKGS